MVKVRQTVVKVRQTVVKVRQAVVKVRQAMVKAQQAVVKVRQTVVNVRHGAAHTNSQCQSVECQPDAPPRAFSRPRRGGAAVRAAPCLVRAPASGTVLRSAQRGPIGSLSQRERAGVRENAAFNPSHPPHTKPTGPRCARSRVSQWNDEADHRSALPDS